MDAHAASDTDTSHGAFAMPTKTADAIDFTAPQAPAERVQAAPATAEVHPTLMVLATCLALAAMVLTAGGEVTQADRIFTAIMLGSPFLHLLIHRSGPLAPKQY